jgi:poly(3-hydroxybutyrate) depolymerase
MSVNPSDSILYSSQAERAPLALSGRKALLSVSTQRSGWSRRSASSLVAVSSLLSSLTLLSGCGSSDQQDAAEEGAGSGGASLGSGGDDGTGGALSNSGGQGAVGGSVGAGGLSGGTGGGDTEGAGGAVGSGGASDGSGGTDGSGGSDGGDGSGGSSGGDVDESAGCGQEPTLADGTRSIQSGGTNRTYALRLPENYDNEHAYRIIFGFHGATGNSGQVAPGYFGLWDLAEDSAIFIAPDAVGGFWNDEADVVLMDDILAEVSADLCIDTSRVMLEGFSQGGAMAWTLACARPGIYRAAVVHSGGGLPRPMSCEPIAFFSSLGQSESGGAGQTSNSDFFADQNGCTVASLPQAPAGGHACSDYTECSTGHPTRFCDYDGGHTPAPNDAGQGSSWMPQEVWDFLTQF